MCSASAALLAFSNHNPIQPASSLTGQDYGTCLLATSIWPQFNVDAIIIIIATTVLLSRL